MLSVIKKHLKCIKVICLLLIVILLSGCETQKSKQSLKFIEDEILEYDRSFKVSDLLLNVDNFDRDDFIIKEDDSLITLPNQKNVMINYTKKEIDLDTINFCFRYSSKNFYKKITIQDTTPPDIECQESYQVQIGNEYFNLSSLIKATDNYSDEKDIEFYFNGSYDVNTAGVYQIEIIAYDTKKNKQTKTVDIIIGEKQDDNVTNSDQPQNNTDTTLPNPPNTGLNNSEQSTQENVPSYTPPPTPPVNNYQPKNKSFTIDTYDTFNECFNAAQAYINQCISNGFTGTANINPIKKDGLNYGYEVTF